MPRSSDAAYPLWIRLPYLIFCLCIIPIYWRQYGPQNFLWFSDIALYVTMIAIWTRSRLLASMMAVGVLPLEIVWTVDFVTGGHLGLAAYMFDPKIAIALRAISLFHLFFPAIVIWMLIRQGYDSRALVAQTLLAWIVLPASYLLGTKEENINWVYGPGGAPQGWLSPVAYLLVFMIFLPVVIFLPSHWLLQRTVGDKREEQLGEGLSPRSAGA